MHRFKFGAWNLGFGTCEAGWPTGLEPATTRTTIWGSTIELRPPSLAGKQDLKIRISFCKQKTGLFAVVPLILDAGGTRICPQLASCGTPPLTACPPQLVEVSR